MKLALIFKSIQKVANETSIKDKIVDLNNLEYILGCPQKYFNFY